MKNDSEFIKNNDRRDFLKQCFCLSCCGLWSLLNPFDQKKAFASLLPDLGDIDRTSVADDKIVELGQNIVNQLQASSKILDDYDSLYYLNELGNSLAYSYNPLQSAYTFLLIKDPQINAFALPGNYVCLHQGLINSTESEAELVSVMSHELAHLIQHHIFRNIAIADRNQLLAIAGTLSGALLIPFDPIGGVMLLTTAQGGAIQNMLSFSREFEKEADRVGQQIMYSANFDPYAMPAFFSRMQQSTKFNNNNNIAFLQTHPVTLERLSEAYSRAKQLEVKHYMRPDSIGFLLIKEKSRVGVMGPNQATVFYQSTIAAKRYNDINSQFYGLALSYFLLQDFGSSILAINQIKDNDVNSHYIILSLKIKQQIAIKDYNQALKMLEQARNYYSTNLGFYYENINLLISIKKYKEAEKLLKSCQDIYPNNVKLWQISSVLYSDNNINNQLNYHYSLAKMFSNKGNNKGAIDQYEQALKHLKSSTDIKMKAVINNEILKLKKIIDE